MLTLKLCGRVKTRWTLILTSPVNYNQIQAGPLSASSMKALLEETGGNTSGGDGTVGGDGRMEWCFRMKFSWLVIADWWVVVFLLKFSRGAICLEQWDGPVRPVSGIKVTAVGGDCWGLLLPPAGLSKKGSGYRRVADHLVVLNA